MEIHINQALHGYNDGHRMISSSRTLSHPSERTLMLLSDLSGPTIIPCFESYLTGYPIASDNIYAIGRTWYAPEMDRPGCVWTHTLLIDFSDLSKIRDFSNLLTLFRRPGTEDVFDSYSKKIPFYIEDKYRPYNLKNNNREYVGENLLYNLYNSIDCPVILSASNSETYEELIVSVWCQQWPRLRRSFSFCTGALSYRKINGSIFDIQVIPHQLDKKLKRELNNAIFVTSEQQEFPNWVKLAIKDLCDTNDKTLRNYLFDYGADIAPRRKSFRTLVELFGLLHFDTQNSSVLKEAIELIAQFENKDDAERLKMDILKRECEDIKRFQISFTEYDLLLELSTTKNYAYFKDLDLKARERVIDIWNHNYEDSRKLFVDLINCDYINPIGEDVLDELFHTITPNDIYYFYEKELRLLPLLISRNPNLASCSEIWKLSKNIQYEIYDTIIKSETIVESDTRKNIIFAMLDANTDTVAEAVSKEWGDDSILNVLEWVNKKNTNNRILLENWKRVISNKPDVIMKWLHKSAPSKNTLYFISEQLNPHDARVHEYGTELWLKLINDNKMECVSEKENNTLMAFILSLAFDNVDKNAYMLVPKSFQKVHDALEREILDYRSWMYLEKKLPILHWKKNWDKCERLRRAMVKRFIEYEWPVQYLVKSVTKRETMEMIVDYCKSREKYKLFAKKLMSCL